MSLMDALSTGNITCVQYKKKLNNSSQQLSLNSKRLKENECLVREVTSVIITEYVNKNKTHL